MKTKIATLFSKLIVLFGVLLIGLGMVQTLPLVVCFEPNGRIELEAATAKGACVDWLANAKPSGMMKGLMSHCVDVPLFQGEFALKAAIPMNIHWPVSLSLQGLVSWVSQSVFGVPLAMHPQQWAQPPPLWIGCRAFLKTIILLL